MRKSVIWLQLLIGWFPIWALYATLLATAHPEVPPVRAALISLRAVGAAALLGLLVHRLTLVLPWPRPVRLGFVAAHLAAAAAYSVLWIAAASLVESVIRRHLVVVGTPAGLMPFFVLGIWFYVMIAGVAYATRATARAALAEAAAAQAELAALRAHLNPHFLFNTLHTVVQLIPTEPRRAARAAEQLAGLLRVTLSQDRDLVPLADEWAFVERYLELERIRFGDRLRVTHQIDPGAWQVMVPSFALQTLVENAVRHGAGPKIDPTEITIEGRLRDACLTLSVSDTGAGATGPGSSNGTGLRRLRDRLAVLFGPEARLDFGSTPDGGFAASVRIPERAELPG